MRDTRTIELSEADIKAMLSPLMKDWNLVKIIAVPKSDYQGDYKDGQIGGLKIELSK